MDAVNASLRIPLLFMRVSMLLIGSSFDRVGTERRADTIPRARAPPPARVPVGMSSRADGKAIGVHALLSTLFTAAALCGRRPAPWFRAPTTHERPMLLPSSFAAR